MLTLITHIESIELQYDEIVVQEEIAHHLLHCDVGFVVKLVKGRTPSLYLCGDLKKKPETNN